MRTYLASGNASNKYAVVKLRSPLRQHGAFLLRKVIMEIVKGCLYFLKDCFFEKVNDPYLKKDHETSQRPHYFAFKDKQTALFWLIPCSSKVEKYERIIRSRQEKGKSSNGIKIVKIQNKKIALLFQDMFPVSENYILKPYIRGGQIMRVYDIKVLTTLEKNADRTVKLLRKGMQFTPTSPNVLNIEKLMLEELQKI